MTTHTFEGIHDLRESFVRPRLKPISTLRRVGHYLSERQVAFEASATKRTTNSESIRRALARDALHPQVRDRIRESIEDDFSV